MRQTLVDGGVAADRIDVVYDGVPIPSSVAEGESIIAPATDDAMKGSDLVRAAAAIAGVEIRFSADLMRDLPGAGLLVYCTRSEGLGSAALLAMAHGVPVVASRIGGLPEIVVDGVNGVLTDNEPHSVAAAIGRALANRQELARNARSQAEQRFSVEYMVAGTRRAYEQVL